MQNSPLLQDYDQREECMNYISHGIGAGLSVIAGILLIIKGSYLSSGQWFGLWVYALSMIFLFSCSMLYHMATTADRRYLYKKIRSYSNLLFNRRHLYPIFSHRDSYAESTLFINCTLGDCDPWYTIQVHFHPSFSETFPVCLLSNGLVSAVSH